MDSVDYAVHNNYEFNGIVGDSSRPAEVLDVVNQIPHTFLLSVLIT